MWRQSYRPNLVRMVDALLEIYKRSGDRRPPSTISCPNQIATTYSSIYQRGLQPKTNFNPTISKPNSPQPANRQQLHVPLEKSSGQGSRPDASSYDRPTAGNWSTSPSHLILPTVYWKLLFSTWSTTLIKTDRQSISSLFRNRHWNSAYSRLQLVLFSQIDFQNLHFSFYYFHFSIRSAASSIRAVCLLHSVQFGCSK